MNYTAAKINVAKDTGDYITRVIEMLSSTIAEHELSDWLATGLRHKVDLEWAFLTVKQNKVSQILRKEVDREIRAFLKQQAREAQNLYRRYLAGEACYEQYLVACRVGYLQDHPLWAELFS